MASTKQKEIAYKNLRWVWIENPTRKKILELEKTYDFHPLDLEECTTKTNRSKVEVRDKYIYTVILLPLFPKGADVLKISELNVFIGKNYIVTIHEGPTPALTDLYKLLSRYTKARRRYMASPEWLLYYTIKRILLYRTPILSKIDDDIDNLEHEIFHKKQAPSLLKEIAIVRRNIIDYRKVVQPHRSVISQLENALKKNPVFKMKATDIYYEDLLTEARETWDQLENFKERIEALQETNESLLSFHINDTMRTLTILSAVLLPMTLMAGIFGMNAESMPFIGDPSDFWIILLIMASLSLFMVIYFRIRRWL